MAKQKEVTFVKGTRPTIVWDQKNDCSLVEFVNGLYTTSNVRIINELLDLGYETTEEYPKGPPKEGFEHQKTTMPPPKQVVGLTPDTQFEEVVEDPSPAKKKDIKSVKNQKTTKKVAKKKAAKRVVKRRKTA